MYMGDNVRILNYNVHLMHREEYDKLIEQYFSEEKRVSMLFLSVKMLEYAMKNEEYFSMIGDFEYLFPGEKNILELKDYGDEQEQEYISGSGCLNDLLEYMEKHRLSLYLIGDQYDKCMNFLAYCKVNYSELNIVGSYVIDEKIEDAQLQNDMNSLCPDAVITAIEPGKQEDWLLNNLQKINSQLFIGANVLVENVIQEFEEETREKKRSKLYNLYLIFKEMFSERLQMKNFHMDYDNYMKELQVKEREQNDV
jgi:UDP-N-acetyl-D-mannosaminuronic acid transferase (WecB/TagA/CpsF family)